MSRTAIDGLDVVLSSDEHRQLNTLLLHTPDGRLRLRNLLPAFQPHYDLLLIDTQGARSVRLEMALLASQLAVSPVTPERLAARELRRGTLQLVEDIAPYRNLGIEPPQLHLLINRMPAISSSSNARLIRQTLRLLFREQPGVPYAGHRNARDRSVFPRGYPKPARPPCRTPTSGCQALVALEIVRNLANELCPPSMAGAVRPDHRKDQGEVCSCRAPVSWPVATSGYCR